MITFKQAVAHLELRDFQPYRGTTDWDICGPYTLYVIVGRSTVYMIKQDREDARKQGNVWLTDMAETTWREMPVEAFWLLFHEMCLIDETGEGSSVWSDL